MPTEPTWEETTAIDEPTWETTTETQETQSPGFLGPSWPSGEGEGESIAEPDPERERKKAELANQMRLARAERGLSDVIESFIGGAARAVEPLTPSGLMNQPTRIAGAITGKPIPDIYQPGQSFAPIPDASGTNALSGLKTLGARTVNMLTTPEMLVTAPAFALAPIRALVAGEMAGQLPAQIAEGGKVLSDPNATAAEKVVAAGNPLVTAAMVRGLGQTAKWLPEVERTIAKAEPILPQAAQASREAEKGVEPNASEISKATEVYGDVQPQPVEGTRQVPVEESRAGVQPQTGGGLPAEAQAPNAAQESGRVLLTPEERLAEQRALDEALGQETAAPEIKRIVREFEVGGKKFEVVAKSTDRPGLVRIVGVHRTDVARAEGGRERTDLMGAIGTQGVRKALQSVVAEFPDATEVEFYRASKEGQRRYVRLPLPKPTPLPEATPTVPPAAEPSQLTPTQQGSKVEPISKATTPSQITQAPFLDIPPEKWTPEYWKRIGDEGRRTVRGNLQGALQKIGSKTKITERSSPQAVFNAIAEVNKARSETPPKPPLPPGPGAKTVGEPPIEPMQAGLGIPGIEKLDRKFDELRRGFGALVKSGPERRRMDQTFDAAENMANIVARQATNKLRLNGTPAELDAIYPFIESKGDINRLQHFIAQATGKNESAVSAAQYALSHWNDPHFRNLARRAKLISDRQIAQEQSAGINTEYRDAYLPHLYDRDLLMGFNRPFVIGGGSGGGMRTGFKKGRTFETIYDAIEAGYPVKSLNAADTLEARVRSGQKLINRVEWADSLRNVVDPTDSQPIVTSLVRHSRGTGQPGWESPPPGYARFTIIPGVDVAVHEGYTSLFDALTGTSRIASSVPGKILLETEGALKHGLLLFDTYHVSRILQKEAALLGGRHMGWRKGLTLLEYGDTELNAALREGLITREMADFARANRADAELLIRSGLNVGRIQENLYNSFVRHMPGIGRFNKWVFEKMTRGAMLQSALIELERVQRDFGLTRQDAAMKVSRDLNAYFGNLGKQGILKSATAQDAARIVALAPQWVESMLRTEIGGVAKAVIDPIKYRKLAVSSLPLGVGTGLAAYFVGAQILNLVTRGKPTWDNPEKGHKLDAWIPDFTGKTGGYFLSPFSVPAEITHDMIRYSKSEPDAIAAASRILSNKQSPLYRATKTLLTGKDWTGEKLIGSWNRIKAASVNLVPAPIGIAPLLTGETYPGQTQRQITASLGVKTEPAPTALQQIRELKKEWGLNNADPKTKHQFEQALKADYGTGDYNDLRRALSAGDMKKANEAYDTLISLGKKRADIVDALSWYSGGKEVNGVYRERKVKPIGGQIGAEAEKKFIASLNPAEKRLYQQAMDERKRIYQKFLEMLKSR